MDKSSILIVDDEPLILNALKRLFIDSPFQVLTCSDPLNALKLIGEIDFAVVISDYRMPGISGIELLSRVKVLKPETVRILLTGFADLSIAIDAINLGEVFRFIPKPWDDSDLLRCVGDGVSRYELAYSLRGADEQKLLSIAQAIELKDSYTRGHCERVAGYTEQIALSLSLSEEDRKQLRYGSWLHDCGKIGVPDSVLLKKGALSAEEFLSIKNHPQWGYDVGKRAGFHPFVLNCIRHHHEHIDGNGYPLGLAGETIPLEARIVAVADVCLSPSSARQLPDFYCKVPSCSLPLQEGPLSANTLIAEKTDP